MRYHHSFTVAAPLAAVRDFHEHSSSMGAITPPPVIVRVHHAPAVLTEGDQMDFTMWLGPLPIRWLAAIEQVTPISFVDRQLQGPFTKWVHHHTFTPVDEQTTKVIDDVEAQYSRNWFWRLVGMGMWLNLPILFAFRQWKTKRILEQGQRSGANTSLTSTT
jgi:ligand-binding SRPBCC domain-containing protein